MPMALEASLPGVFAVGDVRHRSVKRVASAVGEGSVAIQQVHRFLADHERGGEPAAASSVEATITLR
jgi:thioredoxin reductase (NADPH)